MADKNKLQRQLQQSEKKAGILILQCFHSAETLPGQSENWVWHVDNILASGGLLY